MPKKKEPRALEIPPGDITELSFCAGCGQGYLLPQFATECADGHGPLEGIEWPPPR